MNKWEISWTTGPIWGDPHDHTPREEPTGSGNSIVEGNSVEEARARFNKDNPSKYILNIKLQRK